MSTIKKVGKKNRLHQELTDAISNKRSGVAKKKPASKDSSKIVGTGGKKKWVTMDDLKRAGVSPEKWMADKREAKKKTMTDEEWYNYDTKYPNRRR